MVEDEFCIELEMNVKLPSELIKPPEGTYW